MSPFAISFPNGHHAVGLRVHERNDLLRAFDVLAVRAPRPALVLVGGAAGLEAHREIIVQNILRTVAQLVESLGAAIIDGGTQSGVIAGMGKMRLEGNFHFPLIGVAVERKVRWPGYVNLNARVDLDPHHTHFLLVPGDNWGDESVWLTESAHALANASPALTLLINGGEISRQDVNFSLRAGRPVLIVRGTGRLADELADSPPSPMVHVVAAADATALSFKLHTLLTRS